jgi:hypothetical protein
MGFFDRFKTKNPATNMKTAVNIEWVLQELDELGIPASDTTYAEMTGTTLGLVKLNGSYTFSGTINVPTPALPS